MLVDLYYLNFFPAVWLFLGCPRWYSDDLFDGVLLLFDGDNDLDYVLERVFVVEVAHQHHSVGSLEHRGGYILDTALPDAVPYAQGYYFAVEVDILSLVVEPYSSHLLGAFAE